MNQSSTRRISNIEILLINTRVPRSTKKMVSHVRSRYEKVCPFDYCYMVKTIYVYMDY